MTLLAIAGFWRLSETPSFSRAAAAGAVLGGALAVKYSAVLIIPAMAWFLVIRWAQGRKTKPGESLPLHLRTWARWMGYLATVAACVFLVIWASYGFRYKAAARGDFEFSWDSKGTEGSLVGGILSAARKYRVLPESYLYGFGYMFENAQGRAAYALGRHSSTGWWWYFPFAYLVKTPVSAVMLTGLGLWHAIRPTHYSLRKLHFLVIPVIVYGVVACGSNINIGLRHLLPIIPIMMVLSRTD